MHIKILKKDTKSFHWYIDNVITECCLLLSLQSYRLGCLHVESPFWERRRGRDKGKEWRQLEKSMVARKRKGRVKEQ